MNLKTLLSKLIGNNNTLSNNVLFIDYVGGNHSKAQLLSQMFYWSSRSKRKDGFFAKSYEDWYEEIRLPKHSIYRYCKEFIKDGFLETKVAKFNGYPTLHYKLDSDKLIQSLVTFCNDGLEHCATMDSDNLQRTLDSDNLQRTSNRDYQRLLTENTNRESAREEIQKITVSFSDNEINEHMKLVLKRLPEANIQAEFYHQCRNLGINCILEYGVDGARFDAIVFDNQKNALLIVEFKSYKTNKPPKTKTKQISKYKKFGLPIMMVTRIGDVTWSVGKVQEMFGDNCLRNPQVKIAQKKVSTDYHALAKKAQQMERNHLEGLRDEDLEIINSQTPESWIEAVEMCCEYFKTELGQQELKIQCRSAGVEFEKVDIRQVLTQFFGKKKSQPLVWMNPMNYTASLTAWIKTEYSRSGNLTVIKNNQQSNLDDYESYYEKARSGSRVG